MGKTSLWMWNLRKDLKETRKLAMGIPKVGEKSKWGRVAEYAANELKRVDKEK